MNKILEFKYQSETILINLELTRKICFHEGTKEIKIDSDVYSFMYDIDTYEYLYALINQKWNTN